MKLYYKKDGPDIIWRLKGYYINGEYLTEQEWNAKLLFDNVKISLLV
jgi:hypothetical protein